MIAPVRCSPVSRMHADLGASFEREAGWDLPAAYGDEAAERALLSGGVAVGVADVTARAKIDVRGAIEGLLGAAGDALVAPVAGDWALVLGEPGAEEILLPKLESAAGPSSMVTDATHLYAGFALAGPMLPELLARVTGWDPATLAPGSATGAPIAEVPSVVIRRELTFPMIEAYVATEFARYVWETVLGVARRLEGGPVGWRALRAEGWR